MTVERIGDAQQPVVAVIGTGEPLVVLGAPEDGQHVVIPPTVAPRRGPAVIILPLAADVDPRVHRTSPAARAPLRHVHGEIGRVSWRETVCQYVENPVAAGSFKKKKT